MPHKQPQRLQMIEQALKDKAPQQYQQMKRSGHLSHFLKNHEEQMMESYDQAASELLTQVSGPKGPRGLPGDSGSARNGSVEGVGRNPRNVAGVRGTDYRIGEGETGSESSSRNYFLLNNFSISKFSFRHSSGVGDHLHSRS